MTTNSKARTDQSEPSFEGVYGPYCITLQDQHEVQLLPHLLADLWSEL